jgi:hypothetical protein
MSVVLTGFLLVCSVFFFACFLPSFSSVPSRSGVVPAVSHLFAERRACVASVSLRSFRSFVRGRRTEPHQDSGTGRLSSVFWLFLDHG